jgi:hypothetical protein
MQGKFVTECCNKSLDKSVIRLSILLNTSQSIFNFTEDQNVLDTKLIAC